MEPSKKNDGNASIDNHEKEKFQGKRTYARRKVIVPKPSEWKRRRLRLDIGLLAILVLVFYIILSGNNSVIYQQSVIALIGAGVALLGQYVFGAVWDDKNYMNTIQNLNQNTDATMPGEDANSINTGEDTTQESGAKE